MTSLLKEILHSRDWASFAFLGLILSAATWSCFLSFSPAVQEQALRKYHLAQPNYAQWAIQQAVPSIYNFENRYWFSREPLNDSDLIRTSERKFTSDSGAEIQTEVLNHFPTRIVTSADARAFLRDNAQGFFVIESNFRGRSIRSRFSTTRAADGSIGIKRTESTVE